MRLRQIANWNMCHVYCANHAMRPNLHNRLHHYILHICAKNMFDLKFDLLGLCILRQCFDCVHRQFHIRLMWIFDMRLRWLRMI